MESSYVGELAGTSLNTSPDLSFGQSTFLLERFSFPSNLTNNDAFVIKKNKKTIRNNDERMSSRIVNCFFLFLFFFLCSRTESSGFLILVTCLKQLRSKFIFFFFFSPGTPSLVIFPSSFLSPVFYVTELRDLIQLLNFKSLLKLIHASSLPN